MKIIHLKLLELPPEDFTGIAVQEIGTKVWYLNGLDHKEDGPAIEYYDGDLEWRYNGMTHRIGGAAYISKNEVTYYIHGAEVTKEQHDFLYDLMTLKKLL